MKTQNSNKGSNVTISKFAVPLVFFVLGCVVSLSLLLMFAISKQDILPNPVQSNLQDYAVKPTLPSIDSSVSRGPLQGLRILIAIAAFDFGQIPHLEEVLDAYQDLCVTGASRVGVVIHATVAYPVTLIDMFNTRLVPTPCADAFSIKIVLKPSSLRLHLVDCHRPLFYEHIEEYDLFIYTEDDIRVPPHVVGPYMIETNRLKEALGEKRAADFNVGIVRFEYNFPSNVVIDDKTRHATQNVTRVYWEHGRYPVFPNAADAVPVEELKDTHIHMKNHHQGMFLATADLLKAWKERPGCEFDKVKNRPGMANRPSQPSEGTQRVWMSSQMLYGGRHCGIQQVIPLDSFGTLTVLHLPNKNYRRVGRFRNRTFSDGTEQFDFGVSGSLLTAMKLHLEVRQKFQQVPQHPYRGIQMVDEVTGSRTPLLERRMGEYQAYVDRGGVLSAEDMTKTDLVEER